MLNLDAVHQPIASVLAEQLDQVMVIFERQLASDMSAVNSLCMHVEQYRGKMLRPTLVLLSGLAAQGYAADARQSGHDRARAILTENHRIVAAVTEMIHMATLVHDDVLDECNMRRGEFGPQSLVGWHAWTRRHGRYDVSSASVPFLS